MLKASLCVLQLIATGFLWPSLPYVLVLNVKAPLRTAPLCCTFLPMDAVKVLRFCPSVRPSVAPIRKAPNVKVPTLR